MHEYLRNLRADHDKAAKFFAKKLAYTIGPVGLQKIINESQYKIIDVRDREMYNKGHIPGAISIPKQDLDREMLELDKEYTYIIYGCTPQCHKSTNACLMLAHGGFTVMELDGGFKTWAVDYNFETEK